jgi:hypothetical protein
LANKGKRVPRPPSPGEWEIRFWRNSVESDWEKLIATHRAAAARAFDYLRTTPLNRTDRNHPLKGGLARHDHSGLSRWQHEVTGGGRIWFLLDEKRSTVWIENVHTGHPKATE